MVVPSNRLNRRAKPSESTRVGIPTHDNSDPLPSHSSSSTPTADETPSNFLLRSTLVAHPTANNGNSVSTCPHSDRTFTPRVGLVSRLRIYCEEVSEPVSGAPEGARRIRLHW
ncbi:hypothetical protein SprV_0100358100 [Sparganum proliferum]